MTNASIKQYADELSDILLKIEDAKVEASAIIEALRKVAREMVMQSDKLLAKYEAEEQLEMFREAVKIRQRKGLSADTPTIAYYKEAKDADEIVEFLAGHRRDR